MLDPGKGVEVTRRPQRKKNVGTKQRQQQQVYGKSGTKEQREVCSKSPDPPLPPLGGLVGGFDGHRHRGRFEPLGPADLLREDRRHEPQDREKKKDEIHEEEKEEEQSRTA